MSRSSLFLHLKNIGVLPDDGADVRLQKNLLVLSTAMMAAAAVLWGAIYLHYDAPLAAAIPLGYSVASLSSILVFAQARRYRLFRFSQLSFAILLPFLLMLTLGGFLPSSGVIMWSIVTPLGALLFADRRQASVWMGVLIFLLLLAAWLEGQGYVGTARLPDAVIGVFFVLNIAGLSAVAFALMFYFVGEKNQALFLVAVERRKSDDLLANILPGPIAQRLKSQGLDELRQPIADGLDDVTIMFADIVGFTRFATRRSPEKVVSLLDEVFSALDDLADLHGVEKIKTVGDAYMVGSGLPPPDPAHARRVADFALDLLRCLERLGRERGHDVTMRVGIHSGPVVAGVIGKRKYSYDVWGDTVNVAAKLEQAGSAGHILLTAETRRRLGGDYVFAPHTDILVEGHGSLQVLELVGHKSK